MIQTELDYSGAARFLRSREAAGWMVEILRHDTGWMTRKQLAALGYSPRECRLARQHSSGAIISGQRGYKATQCATVDEIQEAIATLHSMAQELLKEELQLQRVYHQRRAR